MGNVACFLPGRAKELPALLCTNNPKTAKFSVVTLLLQMSDIRIVLIIISIIRNNTDERT